MKKIAVIFWSLFLVPAFLTAQVPEMFRYQAVARDENGLMKNEELEVTLVFHRGRLREMWYGRRHSMQSPMIWGCSP